jgi:valyl-tRNA synthetase
MLASLANLVEEATEAFHRFDYARAIERAEGFFWSFCDDYLELVKNRAYGSAGDAGQASARTALGLALQALLKLLAPFLPFVTEEVWSWWQEGSIHRAAWPTQTDLGAAAAADPVAIDAVAAALIGIRGAKSQAKVSMRHELTKVKISGPETLVRAAELAADDLRKTGRITGKLKFTVDEAATELSVEAELAPVTEG